MLIDKNTCLQLLNDYDVVPSKDKGQNYLINETISKRIVDSLDINTDDKVLEIGPGMGSLTHFLIERTNNLSLIDIDKKSCEILSKIYPKAIIENQDVLKSDLSIYKRIISNIPYSITSELIEYVLLKAVNNKQCVFMVQEDAYRRIVSLKGKDYGPLSVLINLKGHAKMLFKVPPSDFYPRPNCVSVVFKIDLFDNSGIDEKKYKIIKTLFANRRKTLMNNMLQISSKDVASSIIEELGLSINVRPEEVSPETYLKLVSLYLIKGQ